MSFRRTIFNLRLKSRVIIFLFLIVFISLVLLYRAVISHDDTRSILFPTLEKKPVRFQSKFVPDSLYHKQVLNSDDDEPLFPIEGNELGSLKDRDLLSANSREAMTNFLQTLYPTNWKEARETDEVALDLKYLLVDYGFESKMSCKEIDRLRLGSSLTFSSSKYIEYGYDNSDGSMDINSYYDSNRFANTKKPSSGFVVKSPSSHQDTKIECMKQVYDPELCAPMGNYRFLREVLLLNALHHPGILNLRGYCLRGSTIASRLQSKGLILVTDIGTPISQDYIQRSSWSRRFAMALQACQLLLYLESSSLGSLRLTRVMMKDFVVIKDKFIKLSDLDDIVLGEKTCSNDDNCFHEASGKAVTCSSGLCEGYNVLSNLHAVTNAILLPLLHPPMSKEATRLVEKLQLTNITPLRALSALRKLYKEAPRERVTPKPVEVFRPQKKEVERMAMDRQDDDGMWPDRKEPSLIIDDILTRFTRLNGKNYVGLYDYPCPNSRVTWGCVFTVTSLKQAATFCYKDTACKSFVVFTTLPESESLMTMVLKNNTDSNPSSSSGTTLFIKSELVVPGNNGEEDLGLDINEIKPVLSNHVARDNKSYRNDNDILTNKGTDEEGVDENTEDEEEKEDNISTEVEECVDRTLQTYESARFSREKRMMAHLGLKGIREQSWRISTFNQDLGSFTLIVRAEGGGGKVLTDLLKRRTEDKDQIATKAMFVAEDGPKAYHVAYTWLYHIDRILGLFHTPPCVGKTLSSYAVEQLHTSFSWEETFRPLIASDGTLTGILMAPTPKVMSVSKLTLTPLEEMTFEIVPFDRPKKLQLEYVLLWWLGGMNIADNEHLGYKGHLMHFHADKAFVNTSIDLSDYLNHCQFPNIAYKTLMCFRCRQSKAGISICRFGEEVSNRVQAMFEDEVEVDIHQKTDTVLNSYINRVASAIMYKVDVCIKIFGRENVLY